MSEVFNVRDGVTTLIRVKRDGVVNKEVLHNHITDPDYVEIAVASREPVINALTVTPTTSEQTIQIAEGTDGYGPITVNAVTSAIDENIKAENIKSGVTILGVTGTYTGE